MTLVSAPTQAQIDAPAAAPTTGTRRSTYSYDAMGRQLGQVDYKVDGTTAVYSRTISYNTRGQIYTDNSYTVKSDGKTYTSNLTNTSYGAGATYAFGAVVTASTYNYVTGGSAKTASTTNTFQWWDSALQATTAYDSDISSSSNTVYNTSYTYNPLGQLTSAYIGDGMPRTVTFSLDEAGQIIRRDETKPSNAPSTQTGSPHEIWYRFGEREWGYVGNNASLDVSMASSIDARQVAITTPGTFRGGALSEQMHHSVTRAG